MIVVIHYSSLFNLRFPQRWGLRSELNSRTLPGAAAAAADKSVLGGGNRWYNCSMSTKKMIYRGTAVHNETNERAHLSVYRLGARRFELHRSERPARVYRARASIDPGMLATEFARTYNLRDIKLELILPTRSEGQR
jgi:hypothetical protein